ncbi:MAG: hypothetical protein ABSB79_13065 [Syntrophales bacterium]|jgi:hypothetical protein
MKDEEYSQEKFYFIKKLVSELHEMQDQLSDREKIKAEFEKEMSQRIRIEEESHKIRSSLEEQLTEREAERDRITEELRREVEERQRIEEESHKIRSSLEEQLTEREAERDRITAERQREVQEWREALDNVRDRLINSKF